MRPTVGPAARFPLTFAHLFANEPLTPRLQAGTKPAISQEKPVNASTNRPPRRPSRRQQLLVGVVAIGVAIGVVGFGLATPANAVVGDVTTVAGSPIGQFGYLDAQGTNARFRWPSQLAVFGGFTYVADFANNAVRRIDGSGNVTTWPSGYTSFNFPTGLAVDNGGNVYVANRSEIPSKKSTLQASSPPSPGRVRQVPTTERPVLLLPRQRSIYRRDCSSTPPATRSPSPTRSGVESADSTSRPALSSRSLVEASLRGTSTTRPEPTPDSRSRTVSPSGPPARSISPTPTTIGFA